MNVLNKMVLRQEIQELRQDLMKILGIKEKQKKLMLDYKQ